MGRSDREDHELTEEMPSNYPLKISEATLNEIIENSEAIPADRISGSLSRLNNLYALAVFYIRASSRGARSELNLAIKDLRREIKHLNDALQFHSWIFEPMRLAAVDKWLQEKSRSTDPMPSQANALANPMESLADLDQSLKQVTDALDHLKDMAQHYDGLEGSLNADLLDWISGNGDGTGQLVRAELSTYFAKGGQIGADTLILRNIAQLYEYAFDRRFSINSVAHTTKYNEELGQLLDSAEDEATVPRQLISDYSGPEIDFVSAVIHSLKLRNAFLRQSTDDPKDRRLISLTGERSATDLELANRIGDLWKNDLRRLNKAAGGLNSRQQ